MPFFLHLALFVLVKDWSIERDGPLTTLGGYGRIGHVVCGMYSKAHRTSLEVRWREVCSRCSEYQSDRGCRLFLDAEKTRTKAFFGGYFGDSGQCCLL
jgi:hypothetical protein